MFGVPLSRFQALLIPSLFLFSVTTTVSASIELNTGCVGLLHPDEVQYPQFRVTQNRPPQTNAGAFYRRVQFRSYADAKMEKEYRNRIVSESVRFFAEQFRQDPKLISLSNRQVLRSSFRVFDWRILIAPYVGMYEPSSDLNAGFLMEKYRLHLLQSGINPDGRPKSFQKMLKQFGYTSLAHGTSVDGLIGILKARRIVNSREGKQPQQYNGSPEYVYLEALPKFLEAYFFKRHEINDLNWWSGMDGKMPVYLEIDSLALDEAPWSHFNFYWMHGAESPQFSIRPSHLLAGFFNMVKEIPATGSETAVRAGYTTLSEMNVRNEFLFKELSLSFVKGIYVDPVIKGDVVAQLRKHGISEEEIALIH